jgi:ABC-2 type transport system ATP-binding protein
MIEIQNLTAPGVTDISLKLRNGKRYALVGDAEAASAILAAVAGCLTPDAGCVTVDGYDVTVPKTAIRRRVGYLPPENPLCADMTVYELLDFASEVKGLDREKTDRRIRDLLSRLGLSEARDRLIARLPAGDRRLVGVAQAALASPHTLLLDSPDEDLSPRQRALLTDLVGSMGEGITVVVACRDASAWSGVLDTVIHLTDGALDGVEELDRNAADLPAGCCEEEVETHDDHL